VLKWQNVPMDIFKAKEVGSNKILAVVQARMKSTRFPDKVVQPILGRAMLALLLQRIKKSRLLDQIIVATSTDPSGEIIVKLCEEIGISVFRGSEKDVLSRIYEAAKVFKGDTIVRLTGDNPLYEAALIDSMLLFYSACDYDFVSNSSMSYSTKWVEERTFPIGLGVQIFSFGVLEEINRLDSDLNSREHVSCYVYQHPEKYRLGAFHAQNEFLYLRHPEFRFTVDTIRDYEFVKNIFEHFQNPYCSLKEVIDYLLKNTRITKINRNESQRKPVLKD